MSQSRDVESLCRVCALCCDGSLFTRVPLAPTEVVNHEALGVVTNTNGGRHVPQRCKALGSAADLDCREYAQRPIACRRYECLLVGAMRGGEVSLSEAVAVVKKAQAQPPGAQREEFLTFHFGRRT
ncbi:MAG: YkgJ family cysteine cluster protein [Archangium sp.]